MAETNKGAGKDVPKEKLLTRQTGCPVAHCKHSLTAGKFGPVVVQDLYLLEKSGQFTREKIPARNVHALGTGCYGTLTVTNDITKYTCAKLFSGIGKKTPIFARFSGIFTEQGDADTTRDPRGFAMKFYTEEGNWDLMGINTPVFAVRDMKVGPDAVHAFKRDPRTGMWNPDQTWDYIANHPESLHQILMLYTDRCGVPASYRHMHAYGCHTFSFINDKQERYWVKFHVLTYNGAKGLNSVQARAIAGEDPNFLSRDLHDAIERGDFPRWKLCCQIMPEEEGYRYPGAFDATKVWKHKDYPLIDIGVIEMNKNPVDYFSEVEQVAFSPTNIVPGIGLSPDRLLQGRLLIYDDTQHHRIGPNFRQLPINRPLTEPNTNYVGGAMNTTIKDKFPHYYKSVWGGREADSKYLEPSLKTDGPVDYYDLPGADSDADYYSQPAELWRILSDTDKNNVCENIAFSLARASNEVNQRVLAHLRKIDGALGSGVERILNSRMKGTYKFTEQESIVREVRQMLLGETSTRR